MTRHQSHNPLLSIDSAEREHDFSQPASPVDTAARGIKWVGALLLLVMAVFLPIGIVSWALM